MILEHKYPNNELIASVEYIMDAHITPMKRPMRTDGRFPPRQSLASAAHHGRIERKGQSRRPVELFLPKASAVSVCPMSNMRRFAKYGPCRFASEVFNCSAPDTGNMEVLERYGNDRHKEEYMVPLLNGDIRSAFLMTEPLVASSDATNIETEIKRDGDEYVINGRKWWSSGVATRAAKLPLSWAKPILTHRVTSNKAKFSCRSTPGVELSACCRSSVMTMPAWPCRSAAERCPRAG